MAQDYSTYLAEQVLNEKQLINYRGLSRALKVHINIAKQMLYEFHRKQNAKHSGSVHATYVVTGMKTPTTTPKLSQQDKDGDSTMRSSPPLLSPSSPVAATQDDDDEPTPIKSIMLVREEHLEEARSLFQQITSIHVYSLAAKGLSEIQILTECNRKVATAYATEDPMTEWKKYGTIQNADVRRRTTKGPPPAAPATAKAAPVKSAPAPAVKKEPAAPAEADPKPITSKTAPDVAKPTTSAAPNPSAGKKAASSIFQSFAKSAAKPKKTESQGSAPAAPANEDVAMGAFSDDEEDDASLPEELADIKVPRGKSKKEREAELQAMMDQEDEDEEMKDAEPAEEEAEVVNVDGEDELAADEKLASAAAEPEETLTVQNGKRRGRRRVMKKKTVRDEEGYLVTKEEAVWESFSEDEGEPAAKKSKAQPSSKSATNTATAPATKKGAGKPGQGSIMSFFGKKG